MLLLLIFLGTTVGSQLQISSDLFLNKLNMSYGINYKNNGLLHHNIHRVWIITKVVVPKLKDVKFPDIRSLGYYNVSKSILLFDKRGNDRIPSPPYRVPKLHPQQYYKRGNSAKISCQLEKDQLDSETERTLTHG